MAARGSAWRLTDQAERALEDLVSRGNFQVGERLPSERDLVGRLGVSRTVVREAVGRLAGRGILRVEPGRGAYVVATPDLAMSNNWSAWVGTDTERILGILEVRETLEVPAAAWAASRVTDTELAAVLETHETFLARLSDPHDAEDIGALDRQFHYRLVVCTHNSMLMAIVSDINEILALARRSTFMPPDYTSQSAAEHIAIVEALVARDPIAAAEAMRTHVQRVRADVERLLTADPVGSKAR